MLSQWRVKSGLDIARLRESAWDMIRAKWHQGPRADTVAHPWLFRGHWERVDQWRHIQQKKRARLEARRQRRQKRSSRPLPPPKGVPRFSCVGLHPDLGCTRGLYTPHAAQYAPALPAPSTFTRDWAREVRSEAWSRNMGYLKNNPVFAQRRLMKEGGGPGWYELSPPEGKGVTFDRSKRFESKVSATRDTPGPGTYKIEALLVHRSEGTICLFERDGLVGRAKGRPQGSGLPPGLHFREEPLCKPSVTKRGPFDVFTGPRDESTIKNHFAPPAFRPQYRDMFVPPSGAQLLLSRKKYGVWSSTDRFSKPPCTRLMHQLYRDPKVPAPGAYEPDLPAQQPRKRQRWRCRPEQVFREAASGVAFGASLALVQRPAAGVVQPGPGPGRYTRLPSMLREISYYSAFNSRTQRNPFPLPERMDIYA